MTTVSTRKLKDGLSAYLRRAEKGERIVVMRGRKAVAAIVPFEIAEDLDEDARLRRLAAQDLVVLPEDSSADDLFTNLHQPSSLRSLVLHQPPRL